MSKKLFGVKVILLHSIKKNENNITKHSYEEMILTIKAKDHNNAQKKANEYAESYCTDYKNSYGEIVITEIISIDSFEAFDEEEAL